MRTKLFLPYLPYAIAAAVNLGAQLAGASDLASVAQYCLMPLLIFALLLTLRPLPQERAVFFVAALLFSWGGDVLLALSFPLGLASFLLAHLSFIVTFTRPGLRSARPWWQPRWAWVYVAWYLALLSVLAPHVGMLLPALAVYGAALGTMAFLAARISPLLAVGGVCFVVSDSLLATQLFLPDLQPPLVGFWVMLSYIAAEALLAIGFTAAALRASRRAPLAWEDAQAPS